MPTLVPPLRVASNVRLRKMRRLPIVGDVLVDIGEQVNIDDVVARATVMGQAVRLNLIEALELKSSEEAARYLLKSPGDAVDLGEEIARKDGSFGRKNRTCASPIRGTLASGPTMSGDILITPDPQEFELQALVRGQVVGVLPQRGAIIEGVGAYIQCIACIGGETSGRIKVATNDPSEALEVDAISEEGNGAVLVGGSITETALRTAFFQGVSAVVVGSITASTFRWLRENPQPVTVLVTEGFGTIPVARHTFDLLQSLNGRQAGVFAAADWGSRPVRADIFVPSESANESNGPGRDIPNADEVNLEVGSIVRVLRGSKFGTIARVSSLPPHRARLESGVQSELIELATEDGQQLRVGRNNVELVN